MSRPCPLIDDWIHSYDSQHPLLDVGCAYGINTFPALEKDIPIIAMDMDSRHLQIVEENVPRSKSHLLTCVLGSLPQEIPLANPSVSVILLSEVLHFLQGDDIQPAFTTLYQKLTPGGYLYVSTLSIHFFDCIDRTIVKDFFMKLDNGHAWPGVVLYDDNMLAKHHEAATRAGGKNALEPDSPGRPGYVHFCVLKQLTDVLCDVGFDIERAEEGLNKGYQANSADNPRVNLRIVAKKLDKHACGIASPPFLTKNSF